MRGRVPIDGVSSPSTAWMGRLFGSPTQMKTEVTLGSRSADEERVLTRWFASSF